MALHIKSAFPAVMSTKDAAKYLSVSEQFLHSDRSTSMQSGTPPQVPYLRIGARVIRYRRDDLDAVLAKSRVC